MKKAVICLSAALCVAIGVIAGMMIRQTTAQTFGQAIVLATCGSGVAWTAGGFGQIAINTAGSLCVNQ
jgi:hypothetical protein